MLHHRHGWGSAGGGGHGHRGQEHVPQGLHIENGLLPHGQQGVDIPHRDGGDGQGGRQCGHPQAAASRPRLDPFREPTEQGNRQQEHTAANRPLHHAPQGLLAGLGHVAEGGAHVQAILNVMLAGVGLSRLLQVLNAQGLALVLQDFLLVRASAVGIRRTAARTTRSTQRLTAVP